MSVETIVTVVVALLGGGGLTAFYATRVTKKLGLSANENVAKKDLSTTWEAIVKALQAGQEATDKRLEEALRRLDQMDLRQERSDAKERLLYGHISTLEAGYPPPIPKRPEGI